MAPPNVVVRSDSWLDLTASEQARRRGEQNGTGRDTSNGSLGNYAPHKRHSIGGASYLDSSLLTVQSTGEPWQQQHLLIRVRQRSYFNSRCSSSGSLSSHLSQSVELNAASESHLCAGQPKLLKRQPLKLATLRESLNTTGRQSKHRQSPLARSFSSLGERVSSKLSNLTSSWKQLLYEYKRDCKRQAAGSQQQLLAGALPAASTTGNRPVPPEQVAAEQVLRSGPLSALHRRQLTDRWVRQHQQPGPRRRQWASVEPGGAESGDLEPVIPNPDRSARFARARSLDTCSLSSSSTTSSPHLRRALPASDTTHHHHHPRWPPQPDDQQVAAELRPRKERSDTRSSSTLVSRSSCSASTLNSHPASHQQQQQRKTTTHLQTPSATNQTTMTQPTSDYWSSSTTNTDYGPRRAQQVPQQIMRRALALAPDAEYYFQVAELERQRCAAVGLLEEDDDDEEGPDFEDYAEPADESCLLDRSQVELVQMIGEGQKGYVFLGKLQSRDGRLVQDVAIKTLKYETEHLIEKLMREAHLMRQLEHPHIIRFIGVCPDTPALIAMELAELGEIKQYLKLNEHIIPVSHLVLFTFQISTALSYLESRQCVHRDVAARNVLVCSHNCVKLADFDLSRDLQLPTNANELTTTTTANYHALDGRSMMSPSSPTFGHYVATAQGKLPIRWLAPESLTMRRFTSASDVWMFAVCAWELFHYGSMRPWHSIRNNQVLAAIKTGQRLARPPSCPERLYQLMLRCWAYSADDRPRFKDIKLNLWSIYLKERARAQLDIEQRQQVLRQSRFVQPAAECFIDDQADFRQQPRTSPHHMPYSYSSNASAYSSSNNPIEHSNNSSRSSTMGSMIRHRPQVAPQAGVQRFEAQITNRFRRIPGQMLERQRSQGSIMTHAGNMSQAKLTCRIRDDQMLLQANKQHQPRPISEMYTDAGRRMQVEPLVGSMVSSADPIAHGTNSRARVRTDSTRPSSTCCAPVLEPSPRRETTYDGLTHNEGGRSRASTQHHAHHNHKYVSQQHPKANSSTYPQDQSAGANMERFRQPNASLTPNSLEEQRQLALHQRLLGHIRPCKPEIQQQHHLLQRRSVNVMPQSQQPTSGSPTTETVDQSLEILESLIAGRNFSNRSAVAKNVAYLNQVADVGLRGSRTSRQ